MIGICISFNSLQANFECSGIKSTQRNKFGKKYGICFICERIAVCRGVHIRLKAYKHCFAQRLQIDFFFIIIGAKFSIPNKRRPEMCHAITKTALTDDKKICHAGKFGKSCLRFDNRAILRWVIFHAQCKAGFGEDPFSALFPAGYGNFIGDIFGLPQSLGVKAKKCEGCGSTWQEIAKSGKVGCPLCYGTFGDELERSIRSIHGNVTHAGRAPAARLAALEKKNRMVNLKSALKTAIEAENFEEAARLRDEIRAMENGEKE